ncbi:MAG TPA: type II secretion system F family protein [Actinomycetota bacterium]|jgi:tight adherence protein B
MELAFTGPMIVSMAVSFAVFVATSLFGRAVLAMRDRGPGVLDAALVERDASSVGGAARRPLVDSHKHRGVAAIALALGGAVMGYHLAGPVGGVAALIGGAFIPVAVERNRRRRDQQQLENQFAECVETIAMAVRSGFSVPRAIEFVAADAEEPLASVLQRALSSRALGAPLERALESLAASIRSSESRLFALLLGTHARTGGNLGVALDELASSTRDRVTVRHDLDALTAQARLSGLILSLLPIGFFIVLAVTSGSDFSAVLRSTAGTTVLASGLTLQALAFVWIRRLLRVRF